MVVGQDKCWSRWVSKSSMARQTHRAKPSPHSRSTHRHAPRSPCLCPHPWGQPRLGPRATNPPALLLRASCAHHLLSHCHLTPARAHSLPRTLPSGPGTVAQGSPHWALPTPLLSPVLRCQSWGRRESRARFSPMPALWCCISWAVLGQGGHAISSTVSQGHAAVLLHWHMALGHGPPPASARCPA